MEGHPRNGGHSKGFVRHHLGDVQEGEEKVEFVNVAEGIESSGGDFFGVGSAEEFNVMEGEVGGRREGVADVRTDFFVGMVDSLGHGVVEGYPVNVVDCVVVIGGGGLGEEEGQLVQLGLVGAEGPGEGRRQEGEFSSDGLPLGVGGRGGRQEEDERD